MCSCLVSVTYTVAFGPGFASLTVGLGSNGHVAALMGRTVAKKSQCVQRFCTLGTNQWVHRMFTKSEPRSHVKCLSHKGKLARRRQELRAKSRGKAPLSTFIGQT